MADGFFPDGGDTRSLVRDALDAASLLTLNSTGPGTTKMATAYWTT